jgi:acetyltransferase
MCDVDFGDMLNYLAMDVDTDVILLYIESVSGTRKFMSAARAAARAKPVIVVKAGYSESLLGSVASHTHALVNSDAVYDAVFRRTGMLRVYSIEELFDAAQTLSQLRKPKGDRLAIVTNGGGVGVLAADALVKRRGHLAGLSDATLDKLDSLLPVCWSGINPVDIVGDADGQRYVDTMEVLFDDDNVDAILAINCPGAIGSSTASAQAVIEMMAARKSLPIFTSWVGKDSPVEARRQFAESKIPTYPTPEHAVRAFMHVVNYYQGKELLMQTPPSVPQQFSPDHGFARQLIDAALEEGREWLTEPESKALLEAYGVPVVTTKTAHTVEEAGSIAAELGSNVVLKILSPEINHKSDVGGVALDLFGSSMVVEAAQAMADRLLAELPQAHISGFSVQPMVRRADAYELIIGMINDPEFGPILLFGQGGTAVEEIDDEALGLPPLNMRLARELISRTRIYRLLDGYRGRSPVNIDAIALTLIKVGQLVIDHAEIAALDINPLICDEAGVMALDARIRLEPCQMSGAERLAIKPYPKELEETIGLEGDVELMIRPIVPEDEPSLHESFTHLTPREIYQRFFTPLKSMTHMMAARFTQLDYDRDMALVLTEPGIAGKTPIYGVVRLAADPDKERAEFAIIVGNIMSGKGLGMAMMQRIINYARHAGIKEVYGDVLRDNEAMLGLCTKLGFSRSAVPDDSTITHVSLVL